MTTNVGTTNRKLRAALGIVLLYVAVFSGLPLLAAAPFKYGAAVFGIVLLTTSTMKMCPLYSIFGIKTCRDC